MKLPALDVLGGYVLFSILYFGFIILNLISIGNGDDVVSIAIGFLNSQINLLYYFVWFWVILLISSFIGITLNVFKYRKFKLDTYVIVFFLSSIVLFCKVI